MTPRVDPLDQYMRTVILKRLGLERPTQDRALLATMFSKSIVMAR
ncbi:hypothetical protein I545_6738 [Mycobacterium kansasii 662]|uniref:Uncharacterized protein n=1 Tax=Mycobacterium kansasii 662 TaxID=1299326 RepID=X7XVZ1_MYCKA|nr:hypothetical protein [Mycobacterium kansasii]ETZ99096.1 hypothetical protein I545_6738 [Mycobacterium kansasii 662]